MRRRAILALSLLSAFAACKPESLAAPDWRDCSKPLTFSHQIMDPASIKVVTPIGTVGAGNTELVGRSYIFAKDGTEGVRLPIKAPTDMQLVGATHYLPQ